MFDQEILKVNLSRKQRRMLKLELLVFLFSSFLGRLDCADVPVKRGEEIILECYGPKNANTRLLKWYKSDKSEFYVFYFRDGKSYENYQDRHFKDRVKLKDPEMKNGDFSVILKNVTMNDTGTYECHAGYNDQEPQLINIINLELKEGQPGAQSGDGGKKDEGEKSGSVGLIVGLSVPAVLLVIAVVGFVIYRKYGNSKYQYPSEQGHQMEMSS